MGIEELNDDEAFEEIVRTVFSEPGAEFEDEDSIDSVVQRIYLMTRRKLGILDPLVKDEDISEIMVNGKDKIFYEKLPLPDIGLTKSLSAILFVILSVPFGKQQLRCFRVRYITAKPGPTSPSSHPTTSKAPTHSRIDETLLRRSLRLRRVHISSAFLS